VELLFCNNAERDKATSNYPLLPNQYGRTTFELLSYPEKQKERENLLPFLFASSKREKVEAVYLT